MYPKNDISWDLDKYQGAFNFRITIDRVPNTSMKVVGVSNIVSESEIVEYKAGHESFVRKIPGRSKFSEIEITRIYQGYDEMYSWRTRIEDGHNDLRTVKVELLAPDLSTVVLQMVLLNCWPLRWQLPNLDASSTGPATETITLACEQVTQSLSVNPTFTEGVGAQEIDVEDLDIVTEPEADYGTMETLEIVGPPEADYGAPDDGPIRATQAFLNDGPIEGSGWLQKYADALALAGNVSDSPFDPFQETVNENTLGDGPIGGRGARAEAEYGGEGEGPIVPTEDFTGVPEPGEDPTFAQHGGEGTLEITGPPEANYGTPGTLDITGPPEADYGSGDGPVIPTEDFVGVPEPGEDPTFAENGGDGEGPIIPTEDFVGIPEPGEDPTFAENGGDGSLGITGPPEADTSASGTLDITGPPEAEFSDGEGPIVPTEDFTGVPEPGEDPTAARNGGDGDGPIVPTEDFTGVPEPGEDPTAAKNGGDGSLDITGPPEADTSASGSLDITGPPEADYGAPGDGPVVPTEGFGGVPEPGEDPTAAQNGGDGSGPVGGRGAQAEADYGSPGSGPVGGRGAQEPADEG